jgi:hypothetical protein
VYLSIEGLPTGEDMEARVERVAFGSIFSLLFSPGPSIEILDQLGRPVKLGLERGDRHLEVRSRDEVRYILYRRVTTPSRSVAPGPATGRVLWRPASPSWSRDKKAQG